MDESVKQKTGPQTAWHLGKGRRLLANYLTLGLWVPICKMGWQCLPHRVMVRTEVAQVKHLELPGM